MTTQKRATGVISGEFDAGKGIGRDEQGVLAHAGGTQWTARAVVTEGLDEMASRR